NPVKWKIEYKESGNNVYDIIFNATIEEGWHLYDLGPYNDGPNPTQFYFDESKSYKRVGNVKMLIQPKVEFDEMFQMEIGYFLNKAQFAQSIQVLSKDSVAVKGYVEWMVCDNGSCLPPTEYEFAVKLPGAKGTVATAIDTKSTGNAVPKSASAAVTTTDNTTATDKKEESIAQLDTSTITPVEAGISATIGDSNQKKSIWGVVLEAILWGFIALLTPCVFPMVPMTVSFFLKNSQAEEGKSSKSKGKIMASFYGLFIVALYTLPIAIIILVTYFAGGEAVTADIFNWLATHWLPNIIFFLVFMIFAASFFGAFEITLPSWMVNKSDTKSDKGGLIGVFFMALTLVLVSFSCTGPIVGTILIKSTQGEIWEPIITMFAFSVAFALPFTIFAFAPSLLKDLPKSGGWLNSVKVVLGFIEVALGFKFLSVADQTYHWGILDREVYLAIWIVVFTLLGFYLLGKIRFAYDTPIDHIGVGRLTLSIIVFTFVVYMIPGMWGAPLKALSGYMPPQSSQDFNLYQERHAGAGDGEDLTSITNNTQPPFTAKYSEFLHLPHGLQGFFEYDEAIAYAKKVGKPLFVDFTGHGCVNCREMEARVWSDPRVLKLLREKFVILALYADDKKEADEKDWVTNESGRVLKSIGKINSHLAMTKFNVNAQPYYTILNPYTEEPITQPRGYDLDVEKFLEFLESGSEVK
ncbi:MAG TPA: cytochrome c biogenesis protein CcdA, partial [Bacteroidales bacterium]|nr:cytochrome c biogenesis protein CcdA [Bacteroidales bacterium]